MNKIILISGHQGSGKTTLAKNLVRLFETIDQLAINTKFATPLYAMHDAVKSIAESYGIPCDEKEGTLLQLLGTEWGRKVKGENVWVDSMRSVVKSYSYPAFPSAICIIDDCRFKNELNAFPEAYKVRLIAGEDVRRQRAHGWRENTRHASEIDLDDVPNVFFDCVAHTDFEAKDMVAKKVFESAMVFWEINKT